MRYRSVAACILRTGLALWLAGCGPNPGGTLPAIPGPHGTSGGKAAQAEDAAGAAETTRVVIDNFAYSPREITVAPGTRVTWTNRDDVPHTVTSSAQPRAFDSGALDDDSSFAFVFQTPGTYDYFCALHPHMTGKVIVK